VGHGTREALLIMAFFASQSRHRRAGDALRLARRHKLWPLSRTVWLAGILLALVVALTVVWDFQRRHAVAIEGASLRARLLTKLTAEHVARTFESIDHMLRAAGERYEQHLAPRSGDGRSGSPQIASQIAHEFLRTILNSGPVMAGIAWIDCDGRVVASAGRVDPAPLDAAAQDLFQIGRIRARTVASDPAAGSGLFIGRPFRAAPGGAHSGQWLINVMRRVDGADGRFAGTVQATIRTDYFAAAYGAVELDAKVLVTIFHRDGTMMFRSHDTDVNIGRNFAQGPLFALHLAQSPEGAFIGNTAFAGVRRIVGFQRVPLLPLVSAVSFAETDVLASWRASLWTVGPATVLVLIALLAGTAALARALERGERQRAELAAAKAVAEAAGKAKDEYLALLSNEIRTPMNAIIGFAELLTDGAADPKLRACADSVRHTAGAVHAIIADVLELARMEAEPPALSIGRVDLPLIARDCLALHSNAARAKGLSLALELVGNAPVPVLGDAERIKQVMLHLLGNAVAFADQGSIAMRLAFATLPSLTAKPEESVIERVVLRVTVENSSSDVSADAVARMLSRGPARRDGADAAVDSASDAALRERWGAAAIGIDISRRLVAAMGGEIGVAASGARRIAPWFSLTLPVASHANTVAVAEAEGERAAGRSAEASVVDPAPAMDQMGAGEPALLDAASLTRLEQEVGRGKVVELARILVAELTELLPRLDSQVKRGAWTQLRHESHALAEPAAQLGGARLARELRHLVAIAERATRTAGAERLPIAEEAAALVHRLDFVVRATIAAIKRRYPNRAVA